MDRNVSHNSGSIKERTLDKTELKARAYDLIAEIERYRQEAQAKLDSLTKELNEVNAQIAEEKDNG